MKLRGNSKYDMENNSTLYLLGQLIKLIFTKDLPHLFYPTFFLAILRPWSFIIYFKEFLTGEIAHYYNSECIKLIKNGIKLEIKQFKNNNTQKTKKPYKKVGGNYVRDSKSFISKKDYLEEFKEIESDAPLLTMDSGKFL